MHQSHLPHPLLGYPADAAYYPQHYMPTASHYQHPGNQVPLFGNGYMFQQPYMLSLQEQDSLLFSMQQDSIDQQHQHQQQQQQHYGYSYGYPQHPAAVMPSHQSAAYGVYASQHQQQSQQSPPGGINSAYPIVTSSAAAYITQASLDGSDSLQQQKMSPIESSEGKPEPQQQQQSQQRRPKQHNTNQALEQISKLMLKLGDEEQISPEERQEQIRRYTDIALTIPVVWNYVCQLSELKHEAELGKVYDFLHHLAQCNVTVDEWKQAVNDRSCVFSVVDGRLRQKVCPILRVQGRSPEKIETLCDDIKQKPSQRYRVQAKHVLEQLHEFFCSFLPAELPQLTPPEQLVVDHASVLVIYPDTDSFEQVNSLLHKLAFTKLCLGPDAADVAETASTASASDDPVDAAKRKWESQLRPCSCPHALSLYAVPGKWQAYPLVADSQWELTRAEIGMSTTLSIKAAMPAGPDAAIVSSVASETVGQLSDAAATVARSPVAATVGMPASAEAATHYTGSPILAAPDVTYQLCGLMDSAGPNPPPQQPMPPQHQPNRIFKHPHQHQYHQHGQGGYSSYSMPNNRRHGGDRQTVPPRFARHVSQNAAYHEHEGAASAAVHHSQVQRVAPLAPPPVPPQQHQQQQQQHHHHHHDYRQSGPPSRSAIGRGGGSGRGYGRGGVRGGGGGGGRDYHSGHAPQGPPEFRLKENDFPEISADAAAAAATGNGGLAGQGHNNSATAAVAATAASSLHADAGDTSPESAIGDGASPEQSQQAGGGPGTSYAAALKKSVPPGSSTKVATVSAIVSATSTAASTGDAADPSASPTSPSPAPGAGVRRAVASAAQPAASTEASSDASDRGYHRGGGGGGGNAWKASPAGSGQQRPNLNGISSRGGREQGSRNASGSNA